MCGNHDAMAEDARALFLKCDHETMISKFHLESDEESIYINVLGETYAVDRTFGFITKKATGERAVHDVMMKIYDMLCYTADKTEMPPLKGTWANLSTLGGIIGASHAKRLHTDLIVKPYEGKVAEMKAACEKLGGKPQPKGDVSYILPFFDFFPVWVQYWDADDEFPGVIQFTFDSNSLEFVHYETLFYIASYLEMLLAKMIQ